MKRFFVYIASLLCMLCACQPTGDDIVLELVNKDPSNLIYTFDRQTVSLDLDCNRSWKASCADSWIEMETSKGSGGEDQFLKFNIFSNTEYTYRTGEIVITAGGRQLVLTITQEPDFIYYIKENFEDDNLIVEKDLPSGWTSYDVDGDKYGWRCWRNSETEQTFAYSSSFDIYDKDLTPDNYMLTPLFRLPAPGFFVKWDSMGSEAEYLGDKYEAWVAAMKTGEPLIYLKKLCEEVTTSATELTHHEFSLDDYVDMPICIVFHHYESVGLSRVLITNVEVSNRR